MVAQSGARAKDCPRSNMTLFGGRWAERRLEPRIIRGIDSPRLSSRVVGLDIDVQAGAYVARLISYDCNSDHLPNHPHRYLLRTQTRLHAGFYYTEVTRRQ